MTKNTPPTKAGQLVVNAQGQHGITTDIPRITTPHIAVQFVGKSYPVLVQIEQLAVVNAIKAV